MALVKCTNQMRGRCQCILDIQTIKDEIKMNKRRVAITGFGIVSSLGNDSVEVLDSLKNNRSGIEVVEEWKQLNMKSYIAGTIKNFDNNTVKREIGVKSRYMDLNSIYAMMAAEQAVKMSGLGEDALKSEETSCIAGSGLLSTDPLIRTALKINNYKAAITPFDINRSMSSSISANLSNFYGIKGRSYSISSACATSLHNVGHSYELVASGLSKTVISGGADEISVAMAALFNGMRSALVTITDDSKVSEASKPYDVNRNGFVLSGGGGIVIIEDLENAVERGATIYGEIIGYGATTDGHDIIQPHPDGEGAYRCMKVALEDAQIDAGDIDYINAHGTSTKLGDIAEAKAIKQLVGDHNTFVSSTKALSGHGLGAAGVHELIYCLLMLNNDFVSASAHISELDEDFSSINIVRETIEKELNIVMTNNFGFGGTNASMLIKKFKN